MAIIDDGVYEWEEVYKDLIEYTEKYTFKNSDYKVVYEEIKTFKEFLYDYLHIHLYEHIELKENEEQSDKKEIFNFLGMPETPTCKKLYPICFASPNSILRLLPT